MQNVKIGNEETVQNDFVMFDTNPQNGRYTQQLNYVFLRKVCTARR